MLFWKILLTEFIAEMGDKTQLMLMAMTSRFKLRDIILGTAAAVLVLNGLAVLAGGLVSELVLEWIIKLVAALAFLYFSWSSLKGDEEEKEEDVSAKKGRFAALSVFGTFFVAELGDKTQLTAITFAADAGMKNAVVVWLACSVGLFAADILGMLLGMLLKNKMPEGFLNTLAFVIFAVFGVITLREGLAMLLTGSLPLWITMAAAVLFAALCFVTGQKKRGKKAA